MTECLIVPMVPHVCGASLGAKRAETQFLHETSRETRTKRNRNARAKNSPKRANGTRNAAKRAIRNH
eukprot:8045422-Lingulodinium_polyedra.AAC.1